MKLFRSIKVLAAAAALAVSSGGCKTIVDFVPPDDAGAPLFEVEQQNSAWFPYWAGFYVDGEGHVYSWDRSDAFDPALAADELTPDQLAQKYSRKKTLVRTLPGSDVMYRYQQAAEAARASLTDPVGNCADAGSTKFSVWVQGSNGNYRRVLLHQRGDIARTRHSDANHALWKWLDGVTTGSTESFCDPFADG